MIVDDQPLLREGLKNILNQHEDIHIVATANNGQQAIDMLQTITCEVILMDIRMPILNGVEATKIIKTMNENIIIIILTTFEDDEYIVQALANGASGYLLKDIEPHQLIQAIKDGMSGNMLLPGRVAHRLSKMIPSRPSKSNTVDLFTSKEKEIIKLLIQGYSNQDIAQTLYLSLGTIKNYISQIYSKANVNDRANAIVYFKNQGY